MQEKNVGAGVGVMGRIAAWLVGMAEKCIVRIGAKPVGACRGGREKMLREYGGKLRFRPEYERLLAFSLFGVARADGKASQFEIGMLHALMGLYREIVGRSLPSEGSVDRTRAILKGIAGRRGEELAASASPLLADEGAFLMECVFQVAKWEGMHWNERIFIERLAKEVGVDLHPDIFERAHKLGMEMTAQLLESNPELRD